MVLVRCNQIQLDLFIISSDNSKKAEHKETFKKQQEQWMFQRITEQITIDNTNSMTLTNFTG
jgi:hypothetical protein